MERRYRGCERPARVPCRLCRFIVVLEPPALRRGDWDWYMTCPNCGGTFPVRAEDAEETQPAASETSAEQPGLHELPCGSP